MIKKNTKIPRQSILKKEEETFDYIDSFQSQICSKNLNIKISEILNLFLYNGPKWIGFLLSVRDKIAGLFGLKTSKKKTKNQKPKENISYKTGDQLGIFKIFDKSENEFILGEDDKHLNFKVSLLLEPGNKEINEAKISITTAVTFNNIFGKIYFFPVKPFHRLIVQKTLKRIVKNLENEMPENKKEYKIR
ncbi:DUF2867 domain-containing protein [Maribellus comscasis]|uniref:DUF2867 domain-containing protein n=1 Tax=Maribellus comscasis TaxID=2681766 RepID=A0A6I6JPC4_9BACT|nr:DUF2867 domain-containing protein [Maribellus comscasis]QGY44815.1 DUF2867 domain-containing protein [Maribellus comscasis]